MGRISIGSNFSKHLPNTTVINAKLSPIKLNKGFKNIYIFLSVPHK